MKTSFLLTVWALGLLPSGLLILAGIYFITVLVTDSLNAFIASISLGIASSIVLILWTLALIASWQLVKEQRK